MSVNSVYKLLTISHKLMAEHGHYIVIAIIRNTVEPRIINNIIIASLKTKTPQVKIKSAIYIFILMHKYPYDAIAKYIP